MLGGNQPRPLVLGPHCYAHPCVGGRDENPGKWFWFEGNFEAYQANRIERLGQEAARPHRIHRKLTRD